MFKIYTMRPWTHVEQESDCETQIAINIVQENIISVDLKAYKLPLVKLLFKFIS